MTISNYTNSELINELVARGVLKADFADKEAKRVARAAAKAERDQALNTASGKRPSSQYREGRNP